MEDGQIMTAPQSVDELVARIESGSDALPKRLRQCAAFLQNHLDRVAISTVAELADAAGVQPSTFMRFCQAVGFSGFSEMQALFRTEYARQWPDYSLRLNDLRKMGENSASSLLAEFVSAGSKSLSELANNTDPEALERAVDVICAASMVHVVGMRRAFPVASYFSYVMDKMRIACLLHGAAGKQEHRHAVRPGDVLVAITFAPFSPETIDLAEYAATHGVPVVCITDVPECPVAAFATETLIAREVDVRAFRTLTASMALITTLAVSVGARRG